MSQNKTKSLEQRVAVLEQAVRGITAQLNGTSNGGAMKPDWDKVWGSFADDPAFEEAMRYGREWRESFRPKKPRRRKPKASPKSR